MTEFAGESGVMETGAGRFVGDGIAGTWKSRKLPNLLDPIGRFDAPERVCFSR